MPPHPPPPPVKPRLVVADDHPVVLDAVRRLLEPDFDIVAGVTNGLEAVDAVQRFEPDLVLLDVMMPELNGFQAALKVSALGLQTGVVIISSRANDDVALKALEVGARGFVDKARMGTDLASALGEAFADRTFVPSASVLPRWRAPGRASHCMQSYASEQFLLDTMARFAAVVFQEGDAVVVASTRPRLAALEQRLTWRGQSAAAMAEHGQYIPFEVHDALSAVTKNGAPDADRAQEFGVSLCARAIDGDTGAPRRIHVIGETSWTLYQGGQHDAAVELERISNQAVDPRMGTQLCPYPAACFQDDEARKIAAICAHHTVVVPLDR